MQLHSLYLMSSRSTTCSRYLEGIGKLDIQPDFCLSGFFSYGTGVNMQGMCSAVVTVVKLIQWAVVQINT